MDTELRPELDLLKKHLTPEKIAQLTHEAVTKSDINLLNNVYIYSNDVLTDKVKGSLSNGLIYLNGLTVNGLTLVFRIF